MKIDLFKCDRCDEKIEVEAERKPITIEYVDGRFANEEKEVLHFCDDCFITFLYGIDTKKERRIAFDKLAEKFSAEDEKAGDVIP